MKEMAISLSTGWNLISFPYTPARPGVADVFSGSSVSVALRYQDGGWSTSVKGEDSVWTGTLGEIAGGCGYWVNTPREEILCVQASESAHVRIVSGWNLVGVIGEREQDADAYFKALDWRVANTLKRPVADVAANGDWEEIQKGQHGTLRPTKGYWVWSDGDAVTMQRNGSGAPEPALA